MAVVIIVWCVLTLLVKGAANPMPSPIPDLNPKVEHEEAEGEQPDRHFRQQRSHVHGHRPGPFGRALIPRGLIERG